MSLSIQRPVLPSQEEVVQLLRAHPLIKLRGPVLRAFVVGSFATDQVHARSDLDVLLEVPSRGDESEAELTERYREPIRRHVLKHDLRGVHDELHPQWSGRRVDLYFTYDASRESRPKIQLEAPATPVPRRRP